MLKAYRLTKSFGAQPLLEDVSFVLNSGDKVGLVGLNGCGKTTLLKILVGSENVDSGSIEKTADEKIGYLPQEFTWQPKMTIAEWINSFVDDYYTELWQVQTVASKLGLTIDLDQRINLLSEGNKMKLYLARILYFKPSVLLLDEPTNHLDIQGIQWMENFVRKFKGTIVLISHDREFLNRSVDKIFEIDRGRLTVFIGNYDDYIIQKNDWIDKQNDAHKRWRKKEKQLLQLIDRSRKIAGGKRKGNAVSAAKHRLQREVHKSIVAGTYEKYERQQILDLKLGGYVHSKKRIIKVNYMSFEYEGGPMIFNNTHFEMFGNDKVWFYGPNGIGKTTFVNLLLGNLYPTSGSIEIGINLSWEYLSQNQSHLPLDITVGEYLAKETELLDYQITSFLKRFLFDISAIRTPIKLLSPGQRARLVFAMFTMRERQLLILDEPTNHLDIQTKETIEEAIRDFNGAVFLISHDRYFVSQIGITKKLTIENGKLVQK